MNVTTPPPLSVHIVWSRESERAESLAPKAAQALFELLNFTTLPNDIQPGPGIPVYLGTHLELIREWRKRCFDPERDARRDAESADNDLLDEDFDRANTDPCMILVPILDREARIDYAFDEEMLRWMQFIQEHQPQCNANLLLLPVPLTRSWLSRIPSATPPCRSAVWEKEDSARLRAIEEDVSLEICHFLMDRAHWGRRHAPRHRVRIFISHAKADLTQTDELAVKVRNYLATTGLKSFFDFNDVARGRDLESQLREGQENSIFLAIQSDRYADSPYCLEEILVAKKYGVPLVIVSALRDGESRRPTYGGNTEVFVYKPEQGETFHRFITMRCLAAWLKHLHFHHAALYAVADQKYPVEPEFISRPPELVDFAHGLLRVTGPTLVFHPDPPLPQSEAALLMKANPKLRLLTPTTAFHGTLARNPAPLLNGYRVGLSLSSSPDLPPLSDTDDGPDLAQNGPRDGRESGLVDAHYLEVTNLLTMSLIRAGASLGYGGHLQSMGFTHFLSRLIGEHKRTMKSSRDLLYSYVARYIWEGASKEDSEDIDARYIRCGDALKDANADVRKAVQLSQMRTRMAGENTFRVIMGGKVRMRVPELNRVGYSGLFPGQAEEAWHQIRLNKPLYVIGAFGGAARMVAQALQGESIAPLSGQEQEHYLGLLASFQELLPDVEEKATPPESLEAMWEDFRHAGEGFFHGPDSDEQHIWTNGLSVADNRRLFGSFNPAEIVELILKGMRDAIGASQRGKRVNDLMLFHGSIVDTPDVDAYAVAVMSGAPLKGADGALDKSLNGALGRHLEARAQAKAVSGEAERAKPADEVIVVSTRDSGLSGDWVLLYETSGFSASDDDASAPSGGDASRREFEARLGGALSRILTKGDQCGISSLAIVLFGANMGANLNTSIDGVLRAIHANHALKTLRTIVLSEYDGARYEHIRDSLRPTKAQDSERTISAAYRDLAAEHEAPGHQLEMSELPAHPPMNHDKKPMPVLLDVRRAEDSDTIVCYAQTAESGAAVSLQDAQVQWSEILEMVHANQGRAPRRRQQKELGIRLAQLVLPESIAAVIRAHPDRPVDIFHDIGAAALPFELFRFLLEDGKTVSPSNRGGMRRRLLARGLRANQRAYKRSFPLKMLLVTNPTKDLDAATAEGKLIRKLVAKDYPDVELTYLSHDTRKKATWKNVLEELAGGCAIFHYAGHAKFDKDNPAKSGLIFPGNRVLTAADLEQHQIQNNPPAVAVINACESAAVRSRVGGTGVTFAEWFLRCGLHAYIGNIWEVEDASAKTFSRSFYEDILSGKSIGGGVLDARRALARKGSADWCNYVLYGDADLRI